MNKLAEKNAIIKDFIGHDYSGANHTPSVTRNNGLYDKSWDALMPVIGKIGNICESNDNARMYLESKVGEISYVCGDVVVCNHLFGVYTEALDFIEKYNLGDFK